MFGFGKKPKSEPTPAQAMDLYAARVAKAGLILKTDMSTAPFVKKYPEMRGPKVSDRYREFFFAAKSKGLAEIEQLVPYVDVPDAPTLAEQFTQTRDDEAGARALLAEFPPATWGYYLPLSRKYGTLGDKVVMGPGYKLSQQRSAYRLNFIFQGLEAVMGGSIKGRSVADIACNWGGFSIEAHLRGASHVLGFDIRPENIAKARRVARHFDADAIDFQVQDLFEICPKVGDGCHQAAI